MKAEKSGLLVNAEKQVIGWVNAGENVEMKNGDTLVSHHKTAEKLGVLEAFNEAKTMNVPVKEKKEKVEGKSRVRVEVPKTGAYTVEKTAAISEDDTTERGSILKKLLTANNFETFWKDTPEKFNHTNRDGSEKKEFPTSGLVSYAIRRGMIKLA